MKPTSVLLGASLLLNLALVGVLAFRPAAPSASPASAGTTASAPAQSAPDASRRSGTAIATPAGATTWDRLKSDDLKTLVANLQRAGFPPAMVRRIMLRVIRDDFDKRRLDIEKDSLAAPFWKQTPSSYSDPKIGPKLRALQREEIELAKSTLGTTLATLIGDQEEDMAMFRYQFGNVPLEKLDPIYNALMDYLDKRSKVFGAAVNGGTMLASDREALAALEKNMRAEVSKYLTPEQAADFDAHMMPMAQEFRYLLAGFQSSEAEFKTLLPLYENFRDQFPNLERTASPEQTAARQAAMDQLVAQASALVGPARATELAFTLDPMNNQLSRLVARLDLPVSAAMEVATVQQDVSRQAETIRSDAALTADQRRDQFSALGVNATARIGKALGGQRGLEAYKMNGGQWLLSLQPPPRRPTPTPAPRQ